MTLRISELIPDLQSDMEVAVENIKKMSDDELIDIAYVMRKVLRRCVYHTCSQSIELIGDFNADWVDSTSIMTYSKLLSLEPYKSVEEVKESIDNIIKSKGGVK